MHPMTTRITLHTLQTAEGVLVPYVREITTTTRTIIGTSMLLHRLTPNQRDQVFRDNPWVHLPRSGQVSQDKPIWSTFTSEGVGWS